MDNNYEFNEDDTRPIHTGSSVDSTQVETTTEPEPVEDNQTPWGKIIAGALIALGLLQEHAHIDATGGLIAVLVEQVLELIGQVEVGSAERVAESLVLVQAGDGLVDILGRRLHDGLLGELWGSALPHPLMNPTLPDRRSAVQPE